MREDLVDALGRNRDARRFLLAMLLTSRYHLTSRPISFANDVFFLKLAKLCDSVLETLNTGEWERLSPTEERGISALRPISARADDLGARKEMSREFGANYRQYFRSLNLPWSRLPVVDGFHVFEWPEPDRILICVGPNIGIGDEMVFFELARRLRRAYPKARLEAVSFHPTVWDLCDAVDCRIYESEDQIAPYIRAKSLLQDNRSLVFFVEFASAPIYRHLETVPGFHRFIYLDTGGRVVRMVDQTKPASLEYVSQQSNRIYSVLDDLLRQVGLEGDSTAAAGLRNNRQAAGTPPRVFVNPFSSKDMADLTPRWWADALNAAARDEPLHAELFCGVNDRARDYATRIGTALDPNLCTFELYGADGAPSIADTLEHVMRSDLLFGLDTFTSHIRNVRPIPAVTVYLSSFWHQWRAPDANILSATSDDEPARVGALLRRLIRRPSNQKFLTAASELERKAEELRPPDGAFHARQWTAGLAECRRLALVLATLDPELEQTFAEIPVSFLDALESAVANARESEEGSAAMRKLLQEGWRAWQDTNFCRYLRFLPASTHAETSNVLRHRQSIRQRRASGSRAADTAESGP